MHRLNRVEYRNTVRDLLSTTLDHAANFPADDISYGFDNISQVLTMSPLQFELYEQAATELAAEAMYVPTSSQNLHYEAETLTADVGQASGDAWLLWSNGGVVTDYQVETAGQYVIRARVWASQAGPENAQAAITVDTAGVQTFEVPETENNPGIIEATVQLSAGAKSIGVAFLNDYYMPPDDRNLYVDWVEVEGPMGVVGENPVREEILFCDITDPTCVREVLAKFAQRAWRRPASEVEVDRLVALHQLALSKGDDSARGVELALSGILLSPHFLFRPELDDDPQSETSHPLNNWELASRLSYFLWSSMPDAALHSAAAEADLQHDATLRAQVDRMLASDKSEALIDNFAGQWLQYRNLPDHVPDYAAFPSFDESLRSAIGAETRMFFREFLRGNAKLNQLLSANFTFLNDRLAQHYNLPAPGSSALVKVTLPAGSQRSGLLGQASVLTLTSYTTRTSPTKRGKWIMDNLLCDRPEPPPAGVPGLDDGGTTPTGSLRELLEAHRKNPKCYSCHVVMDPMGFALEHYDGIGAWRDKDKGGYDIDTSGKYYIETDFDGATELAHLIEQDPRFSRCMIEKLFVYGLGRGVEKSDKPFVDELTKQFAASGYDMPELIKLLVTSAPFRTRRGIQQEASQ